MKKVIIGVLVLIFIGYMVTPHNKAAITVSAVNTGTTGDVEKAVADSNEKRGKEYESSLISLPKSTIIPNPDVYSKRQGTIGVVNIDGNYYVGFYCGLDKVWDGCMDAENNIYYLKACKKDNESVSEYTYTNAYNKLKSLTPYIKSIQDSAVDTDPDKLMNYLHEYMKSTAIMNYKNADSDMEVKLQSVFRDSFLVDTFGNFKFKEIQKVINEKYKDDKQYPALNVNVLE